MIYSDDFLRGILTRTKVIALVGLSANTARASNVVAHYMSQRCYRVIGVNPGLAGQVMFGEKVYPDLQSIPDAVDMVDIFRRSEDVAPVVDAALARWPELQTIWMQLSVTDPQAAAVAEARGVDVVQDRCPKIEISRLGLDRVPKSVA